MLQQLYKIYMAIGGMAVSQTVPKSNGTQVKLNFAIKRKYYVPTWTGSSDIRKDSIYIARSVSDVPVAINSVAVASTGIYVQAGS